MRWHLLSRVSGSLIYSTSSSNAMDFKRHIRELPDLPEARARFRDITPLLQNGKAFQRAVDALGGREWLWDCEVFSQIRYE